MTVGLVMFIFWKDWIVQIFEKILNDYKKSASMGFYWTDEQEIIEQIHSELEEVKIELQKGDKNALQDELGDVLHAWATLVDLCGVDLQETIALAGKKFERRFAALEAVIAEEEVHDFKNLSREQKLVFWKKAKQKLG